MMKRQIYIYIQSIATHYTDLHIMAHTYESICLNPISQSNIYCLTNDLLHFRNTAWTCSSQLVMAEESGATTTTQAL
jgi:hypothetical protein